jgi:hypothetical protein
LCHSGSAASRVITSRTVHVLEVPEYLHDRVISHSHLEFRIEIQNEHRPPNQTRPFQTLPTLQRTRVHVYGSVMGIDRCLRHASHTTDARHNIFYTLCDFGLPTAQLLEFSHGSSSIHFACFGPGIPSRRCQSHLVSSGRISTHFEKKRSVFNVTSAAPTEWNGCWSRSNLPLFPVRTHCAAEHEKLRQHVAASTGSV